MYGDSDAIRSLAASPPCTSKRFHKSVTGLQFSLYTYIHTYIYIYIYIYTCMYIYTHTSTQTYISRKVSPGAS